MAAAVAAFAEAVKFAFAFVAPAAGVGNNAEVPVLNCVYCDAKFCAIIVFLLLLYYKAIAIATAKPLLAAPTGTPSASK